MDWTYGITTVPRRTNNLLKQTVECLGASGFVNPILFVDGNLPDGWQPPPGAGPVVSYQPTIGALQNWMVALMYLYVRRPRCDRYAIFEDDLICCSNLKDYLDCCEFPKKGYLNLLTHDENVKHTRERPGWHKSNQLGKGAVGLVFNREAVKILLTSPDFIERPATSLRKAADGLVCDVLVKLGWVEYIHYPSLLQHEGIVSAIGPGHRYGRVSSFFGTEYNPLELFKSGGNGQMDENSYISRMVAPGQPRPAAWRKGIIQIHITRACDMACFGCTQGSNLAGKPVMITPEEFEVACHSLQGYDGVIGVFGGNPAVHPKFEELCQILAKYFPKEQRGLWCNHPRGKGKIMREIFNPRHSNLNVHLSREAYDEFKRDWPECNPVGLKGDSQHSPPFVALQDQITNEKQRWEMIADCDINKYWSAMICTVPGKGLRAFFCEVAGAMAMLHADDPAWPDLGLQPIPGWWKKPIQDFGGQIKHYCHRCGIPLRRKGQLAIGGTFEETSEVHKEIYKPKVKDRPVKVVTLQSNYGRVNEVTNYLGNAVG
jgi:hypothetical protein